MILPLVFNRIVANNRIPQRLLSLGNRYAFFVKYWGILYFFSMTVASVLPLISTAPSRVVSVKVSLA